MTAHQRNVSASIDPVKLDRLAEVAVKVGLRLQPGQDLLLTAPSVALPLVRRIAEHAYKAGAGIVTPFFSDEEITLSRPRGVVSYLPMIWSITSALESSRTSSAFFPSSMVTLSTIERFGPLGAFSARCAATRASIASSAKDKQKLP
jgi:hypothetical protein